MPESLEGKVAIVTGSSKGIGQAIAEELGQRGAKVVLTFVSDKSREKVDETVARIKAFNFSSDATKVQADLRETVDINRVIETATKAFGNTIDILVNNAGVYLVKKLTDLTLEDYNNIFNLNIRGTLLMTQAVIPHLPNFGGRIINIGSVGGREGFAGMSLYCSTKAGLEGLTRTWASELGHAGHTVNQVNPGPVESEMLDEVPSDIVALQKQMTPIENRIGRSKDISQIVGFLSEEGSRWVSGQVLSASGGLYMY